LTRYVGYYFNLAKEEARRGVGFAMVILQREDGVEYIRHQAVAQK